MKTAPRGKKNMIFAFIIMDYKLHLAHVRTGNALSGGEGKKPQFQRRKQWLGGHTVPRVGFPRNLKP